MLKSSKQEDIMFSIMERHNIFEMVLKDLGFSNEDLKCMNLPGSDVVKAFKENRNEVLSKFRFSENADGDIYVTRKDYSKAIIEKEFFYYKPMEYTAVILNQLLLYNLERETKLREELIRLEIIRHKLKELIGI